MAFGTASLALVAALAVQAPAPAPAGPAPARGETRPEDGWLVEPEAPAPAPSAPGASASAGTGATPGSAPGAAPGSAPGAGTPAPGAPPGVAPEAPGAAPYAAPGPGPALAPGVVIPVASEPPPPPRWRGRGLMIGAAIAGGINVALVGARIGLGLGEISERRETAAYYLTVAATPIDVAAGIGLAAGAGYVRGRWDGWDTAYQPSVRNKLRYKAFVQSGATLIAIGAVGYVMAWMPWHGDGSLEGRGGGTLVIEGVSSLVLMGASGVLAYGLSWRKHATQYGHVEVALRPTLARGFAGLALSGRF